MVTRAKASQDRAADRAAPETTPGRASGRPAASGPQTGVWELAWLSGTGPEVLWCHARCVEAPQRWELRFESGVVLEVRAAVAVPLRRGRVGLFVVEGTLAALRQRAASALAAPPAAETPSRPAGGRQRATSRRGGGR